MNELRFYVKGLRKTLRAYEKSFKCERPKLKTCLSNEYIYAMSKSNQSKEYSIHTYIHQYGRAQ